MFTKNLISCRNRLTECDISVKIELKKSFANIFFSLIKVTTFISNYIYHTTQHYVNRGSHVFACFVDYTKAFDCVNYWKLFNKLLDDKVIQIL